MSVIESQSHESLKSFGSPVRPSSETGPLGDTSTLSRRQLKLEERLGLSGSRIGPNRLLSIIGDLVGDGVKADRFEIQWRAAGLSRPGVIAHLSWPRLATRIGLSIEPMIAHAIVDRLLGFERLPAEGRGQTTPVEWGILSFVAARALDRIDQKPGPLGHWDLTLDRVGPDPFDATGLGPMVTWKWRIRIGEINGMARLWVPESVVALWLLDEPLVMSTQAVSR